MINIHDKKCLVENCNTIPNYNIIGETKGIYCNSHKLLNMINVKTKYCKNNCGIIANSKYEQYCARCFASMFPDKPMVRNIKTKERSIVEFIKEKFPNSNWIFDKQIAQGISKRRPDIFLDLGKYIIIVEIDENQHIYYDCSCNNKRLMQLSIDSKHRPMVVIRFNPDKYIDENSKKVPSCWSIVKKTGLLTINNEDNWNKRLEMLKETIDYWIKHDTDKLIEPIELFYDQNIVNKS